MITTAQFCIRELEIVMLLDFNQQELAKEGVGSFATAICSPEKPFRYFGELYPFVVFPFQISSELRVKPLRTGILCKDEAQRDRIVEAVKRKNRVTPSVGLVSASGFFHLATLEPSKFEWSRDLRVLNCLKHPKKIKGRVHGWSLRLFRDTVDKERELVSERFLPVTTERAAQKLYKEWDAELDKAEAKKLQQLANAPKPDPSLRESEWLCMSKALPDTVALMRKPGSSPEDIFAAYQREMLVLTQGIIGTTVKKENWAALAKLLNNARRRQHSPFDAVGFELIAGYRLRGYDKMTPQQKYDALKSRGLEPTSPAAVEKKCLRLKLPPCRKRGAPSGPRLKNKTRLPA